MNRETQFRLLADLVLSIHVAYVAFVVLGLILVLGGGLLGWAWVRNPWFRVAHLVAIAIVAAQAWLGLTCPLTTWEMQLRARAGHGVYSGSFIAHWLQSFLYWDVRPWVFTACYTAVGIFVVLSWFAVRPRSFRGRARREIGQ